MSKKLCLCFLLFFGCESKENNKLVIDPQGQIVAEKEKQVVEEPMPISFKMWYIPNTYYDHKCVKIVCNNKEYIYWEKQGVAPILLSERNLENAIDNK